MLLSFIDRPGIINVSLSLICHATGGVRKAAAQHEIRSTCVAHIGAEAPPQTVCVRDFHRECIQLSTVAARPMRGASVSRWTAADNLVRALHTRSRDDSQEVPDRPDKTVMKTEKAVAVAA